SVGIASGAQASTAGTYFVGSESAAGFFKGRIAEVVFFATELTTDQKRRVATALAFKYDLPEICVRPRVRWRTSFVEADSTVSGFRPPLSLYQVHFPTNPVVKQVPPPYRSDLSALSMTELATEAASIGALVDSQYFVDAAAGYMYLTLYQDPAILRASDSEIGR